MSLREMDVPVGAPDLASGGEVGDYVALLKPRVMSLVIFTAVVGMLCAPVTPNPVLALASLLAISVGAGAAGALNMWYDADIDRVMSRTRGRPIPSGRVSPEEAFSFGLTLSIVSVLVLGLAANWLAAGLLAFTILFYAVVYTAWLKRRTPQNIVIGGLSGSLPPLIGWTAVTGDISLGPVVLVAIIFMWTPPHFWALALVRSGDYERAGVPMMPVVAGRAATRRQILLYSLALVPLGVVPALIGLGGVVYLGASVGLGAIFLALAVRLSRGGEAGVGPVAKQLFAFSILYLFSLFAALLVEHLAALEPLPAVI